jgi:hypothetical protein
MMKCRGTAFDYLHGFNAGKDGQAMEQGRSYEFQVGWIEGRRQRQKSHEDYMAKVKAGTATDPFFGLPVVIGGK